MANEMNILQQILEQIYGSGRAFKREMYKDLGIEDDWRGDAPPGAQRAPQGPSETEAAWEEMVQSAPKRFRPMAYDQTPGRRPGSTYSDAYVNTPVEPAYPRDEGFNQRGVLEDFKRMNPDLNWDKVAQQAGGNVPGGNFSAMESDIKQKTPGASDEEFYKWVEEQTFKNRMSDLTDPNKRTFNPEAAALIIEQKRNEQDAATRLVYNKAQEMKAQAELEQMEIAKKQAQMAQSPQGKMESTINFILQNVDPAMSPELYNGALRARIAMMNGDIPTAMEILSGIQSSVAGGAQPPTDGPVFSGGKLR